VLGAGVAVLLWTLAATGAGPSFAQPNAPGAPCTDGTLVGGACTCAPPLVLGPEKRACRKLVCTGGMVSQTDGSCGCPGGTVLQGKQCVPIAGDTHCPAGDIFANGACVAASSPAASCGGGASVVGHVCVCPQGTHNIHGGGDILCAPICAAGQQLSPSSLTCVAKVCTGGKVLQGADCACPAGTKLGPQGQQCLAIVSCPSGQMVSPADGQTCVNIPKLTCQGGAVQQGLSCTCPAGTHNIGGAELRCAPVCAAGQQLSPDGGSCVTKTCANGMVLQGAGCGCPAGTKLGPQGLRCQTIVSCPAGQMVSPADGQTCVNIPKLSCQGGMAPQGDHCGCPDGMRTVKGPNGPRCVAQGG
jgi:hypothetical protein